MVTIMSFSQSVKDEILKNIKKIKGCCATSFLTAVVKSVGSLCVDSFGYCVSVETDNGVLTELCGNLAQSQFDIGSAVYEIRQNSENFDSVRFVCKFDAELGKKLGLVYYDADGNMRFSDKPCAEPKKECCQKAFMQGLFLSCGSVSVPDAVPAFSDAKPGNYHLELRFTDADFAESVAEKYAELQLKKINRKNTVVLYLKDSEKIADFLVFVGAVNAKFMLENIIIQRSFRNNANRQSNCIDSNIDKVVSASLKQRAAIDKLAESGRFELLPQQLKDVAIARKENPDATLGELAAILGISKSGVNHRLARLAELAEEV